jgi:cell division protein ZapA
MDEKFIIRVDIADKIYTLRIKREDEQLFRDAAKHLRIKMNQYRQKYVQSERDPKELLAMAALQLAVDKLQLKDRNDTVSFTDKIKQLTGEIESYLEGK